MGRAVQRSSDFTRWRVDFRRRMVARYGEAFAAEVMVFVDEDVEAFGEPTEDYTYLEVVSPGRVFAQRRAREVGRNG